jgi:hypothetical protein
MPGMRFWAATKQPQGFATFNCAKKVEYCCFQLYEYMPRVVTLSGEHDRWEIKSKSAPAEYFPSSWKNPLHISASSTVSTLSVLRIARRNLFTEPVFRRNMATLRMTFGQPMRNAAEA